MFKYRVFLQAFRGLPALLLVFASQAALAGGHAVVPGSYSDLRMMEKIGAKLDLSEAQKKDFGTLLELYGPRFSDIMKRGKADRQALLAAAPDAPDYTVLAEKVSAEAARSAAETVTLLAELQGLVYALLTPPQQEKYLALRAEQRERMESYRERKASGDYSGHKYHHGHHGKGCACAEHAEGQHCPHEEAAESPLSEGG